MAERGVLGHAEGPVEARGLAQAGVSVGPAVDVAALRISGLVCRCRKRRSGEMVFRLELTVLCAAARRAAFVAQNVSLRILMFFVAQDVRLHLFILFNY